LLWGGTSARLADFDHLLVGPRQCALIAVNARIVGNPELEPQIAPPVSLSPLTFGNGRGFAELVRLHLTKWCHPPRLAGNIVDVAG
jgi:hypothetical protein